jgi:hypothetical protein
MGNTVERKELECIKCIKYLAIEENHYIGHKNEEEKLKKE